MTGRGGRPAWWSVSTTRAAVHLVPPGGARERWRAELTAELWELTAAQQLRHTVGVLRRAPALRAAVTARDRVIKEDIMRKPLRCRLHWHTWVTHYSSDGTTRFLRCRRCPKEADIEQRPPIVFSG
jgi:hypothetical protein